MQRSTNKTTLRSEGRSTLKKNLKGPTLLEMSGKNAADFIVIFKDHLSESRLRDVSAQIYFPLLLPKLRTS